MTRVERQVLGALRAARSAIRDELDAAGDDRHPILNAHARTCRRVERAIRALVGAATGASSPSVNPSPAARHGLRVLAGFVEAGAPSDVMGYEWENMSQEMRRDWHRIEAAIRWIRHLEE